MEKIPANENPDKKSYWTKLLRERTVHKAFPRFNESKMREYLNELEGIKTSAYEKLKTNEYTGFSKLEDTILLWKQNQRIFDLLTKEDSVQQPTDGNETDYSIVIRVDYSGIEVKINKRKEENNSPFALLIFVGGKKYTKQKIRLDRKDILKKWKKSEKKEDKWKWNVSCREEDIGSRILDWRENITAGSLKLEIIRIRNKEQFKKPNSREMFSPENMRKHVEELEKLNMKVNDYKEETKLEITGSEELVKEIEIWKEYKVINEKLFDSHFPRIYIEPNDMFKRFDVKYDLSENMVTIEQSKIGKSQSGIVLVIFSGENWYTKQMLQLDRAYFSSCETFQSHDKKITKVQLRCNAEEMRKIFSRTEKLPTEQTPSGETRQFFEEMAKIETDCRKLPGFTAKDQVRKHCIGRSSELSRQIDSIMEQQKIKECLQTFSRTIRKIKSASSRIHDRAVKEVPDSLKEIKASEAMAYSPKLLARLDELEKQDESDYTSLIQDCNIAFPSLIKRLSECCKFYRQYCAYTNLQDVLQEFVKHVAKFYDFILFSHANDQPHSQSQSMQLCVDKKCNICDKFSQRIFKDKRDGGRQYGLPITNRKFCELENIIYLILCREGGVEKRYVGKSTNNLKQRYARKENFTHKVRDRIDKGYEHQFFILHHIDETKVFDSERWMSLSRFIRTCPIGQLEGVENLWIKKLTNEDDLNVQVNFHGYSTEHVERTKLFLMKCFIEECRVPKQDWNPELISPFKKLTLLY